MGIHPEAIAAFVPSADALADDRKRLGKSRSDDHGYLARIPLIVATVRAHVELPLLSQGARYRRD